MNMYRYMKVIFDSYHITQTGCRYIFFVYKKYIFKIRVYKDKTNLMKSKRKYESFSGISLNLTKTINYVIKLHPFCNFATGKLYT